MKKYNNLYTDEYVKLDSSNPLPEYPYPNFKRDSYYSLNGKWHYKITSNLDLNNIDKEIIVPFPIESTASQAKENLKKGEYIVYKKEFDLPDNFIKDCTFIHFIGVDQRYKIILNDSEYDEVTPLNLPSKIDISKDIKKHNELIVIVKDDLDFRLPLGKQSKKPKGIFYTPFSGIYFPVFIESVNENYIENIKINTNMTTLNLNVTTKSLNYKVKIYNDDILILSNEFHDKDISINIPNPILWSPSNPHLYNFEIETEFDKITSYFGLREFKIQDGFIYLNNKKIFLNGVLDQGYYPEGIVTPSTYKSIENDILTMKDLGFNTLRKHIKVEIPYFYYLCDKYGMLVLQDFINTGKYNFFIQTALPTIGLQKRNDKIMNRNKIQRSNFINGSKQLISYLSNYASIVGYTIFNEGWGQFDSENVYQEFKKSYPNLIFDTTSGWYRGASTDLPSYHWYFKNLNKIKDVKQPIFLSEFGALCYKLKDHCYGDDNVFGYTYFDTYESLNLAFKNLYEEKIIPYKDKLIGTIFTQLSDIEEEDNGILSYDRKVLKFNKDMVKEILHKLNNKKPTE